MLFQLLRHINIMKKIPCENLFNKLLFLQEILTLQYFCVSALSCVNGINSLYASSCH